MVPELCLAAKAAELDHRKREFQTVTFSLLNDLFVQLERRHVLRRGFRNQPAVVPDWNEDTHVHDKTLCVMFVWT